MINAAKESKTTVLTAPDITCNNCANSIKKALGNVEGVSQIAVDVNTKKVTVEHDDNASREKIVAALDKAGFPVE